MTSNKKRRTRGEGNIRKRPNGTWEARFVVGRDLTTGKDIYKSVYAKTQGEVRQKLLKNLSDLSEGKYIEPSKMTLEEWLDQWIKEYAITVQDATLFAYESTIRLYLNPYLGKVKLCDLTSPMIQHLYKTLFSEHDGKAALSAKTIKNINGILHQALQQAVELNYIRFNPTNGCKLPKWIKKDIKPLSDQQLKDFLDAIDGNRYEILYKIYIFTGLREGELLGLSWDDVDFNNGTILIKQQLSKGRRKGEGYYIHPTKNQKSRHLIPAPFIMKLLMEQKTKQTMMEEEAGSAWMNEWNLVFTHESGKFISYRAIYDEFKRIADRIGIPDARIHDLRHTFAVNSIRAGDDIKTVQGNLGHATAAFTLDVYGHYTDDMKRASANRMETFYENLYEVGNG